MKESPSIPADAWSGGLFHVFPVFSEFLFEYIRNPK